MTKKIFLLTLFVLLTQNAHSGSEIVLFGKVIQVKDNIVEFKSKNGIARVVLSSLSKEKQYLVKKAIKNGSEIYLNVNAKQFAKKTIK